MNLKTKLLVCLCVPIGILINLILVPVLIYKHIDSHAGALEEDVELLDQYVTYEVDDYGIIAGNQDNEAVKAFVFSFFPEEISPDFSFVNYAYLADKAENGGFEVYLEVTAKKFSTYVANIAEPDEWHTFAFDPAYQEYTVANELELEDSPEYDQNGTPVWYIKSAKIGKVLYNAEKQRIIFWALGVSDGGRASTGVFHNFFNRFQVEPNEYAATADTPRLPGRKTPGGLD